MTNFHCSECNGTWRHTESCPTTARWDAASYHRTHDFSREEEYIISKLASKPTLATALDGLYRRNPRRWHQVVAAAIIQRRSGAANGLV